MASSTNVADAVRGQDDMTLVGVADVTTDCRTRVLQAKDIPLFVGTSEAFEAFRASGIPTAGGLGVAGGGDTVSALNHAEIAADFTFVSAAGGAFLIWVGGAILPGIAALQD